MILPEEPLLELMQNRTARIQQGTLVLGFVTGIVTGIAVAWITSGSSDPNSVNSGVNWMPVLIASAVAPVVAVVWGMIYASGVRGLRDRAIPVLGSAEEERGTWGESAMRDLGPLGKIWGSLARSMSGLLPTLTVACYFHHGGRRHRAEMPVFRDEFIPTAEDGTILLIVDPMSTKSWALRLAEYEPLKQECKEMLDHLAVQATKEAETSEVPRPARVDALPAESDPVEPSMTPTRPRGSYKIVGASSRESVSSSTEH